MRSFCASCEAASAQIMLAAMQLPIASTTISIFYLSTFVTAQAQGRAVREGQWRGGRAGGRAIATAPDGPVDQQVAALDGPLPEHLIENQKKRAWFCVPEECANNDSVF